MRHRGSRMRRPGWRQLVTALVLLLGISRCGGLCFPTALYAQDRAGQGGRSRMARTGPQPAAVAGRGSAADDGPPRFPGRGGRRRARHRQPGGDDLRRARPDLDHREPRISPPPSRARAATGSRSSRTPTATARPTGSRSSPRASTSPRESPSATAASGSPTRPISSFSRTATATARPTRREVVATGFGRYDTHELPNSLTWGPDGWLYGWNGVFNPGKVVSKNGKTYEFTCAIFRIHPKTRVFEVWCEGTSNPWGIAIDPEGSFFASACVIDHLWHLVETGYYIRQGGPYPPFTWPIESIVDHAHQKAAYCGIHYFDSPAYPPEYRGRLYMGNIHGNGINVDVLERNGSTYRAKAAPDFLRANDSWFMPVSQKTGPDGCLYILDWYDRYHCYQDANRDPAGHRPAQGPALPRAVQGDAAASRVRPGASRATTS